MPAFALAACGSGSGSGDEASDAGPSDSVEEPAQGQGAGIPDATYVSTEVTGHDLVPGTAITLGVDHGNLSVAAGCNTQFSAYELVDGILRWTGQPATTLMACAPEREEQDQWLAGLFTAGLDARMEGTTLTLTDGDVTLALTSERGADLTGVLGATWTLTGLMTGGEVGSLPAGVRTPRLVVDEEGNARLDTGCNTGSTRVEVDGDTLVIGPSLTTKMACDKPAMKAEHHLLTVLDGATDDVLFDGTVLVITTGDKGLVFRVE
jgi:heat shock protein HslJ